MRKRIFIVAAAAAIGLTGCASVPSLSEQQNNAMAEYIADNLLKYDKNYSNSIKLNSVDETSEPEPTIQPTATPEASKAPDDIQNSSATVSPNVSGTPKETNINDGNSQTTSEPAQTYVSLSDAMQLPGFKVKFKGYRCDTNISTNDSNISAKTGKKLFVIKMKMKNNTNYAKKIDMTKNHSKYTLSIAGKQMDSPLLTIADEDIHFIKKKVAAKKSLNTILVFEIPSNTKMKNVVLEVTNNDAVAQLKIK